MFKLIAFYALLSVAAARPGLLGAQTSLETIGTVVNSIPTAITHQSQTQIHTQPIISSLESPVISSIAVPSGLQETEPIISSQILPSSLLQGQGQILSSHGAITSEQASLLNEQGSIVEDQGPLFGDESLILRGQIDLTGSGASIIDDQSSLIARLGLLADSIDASGLELNGLRH